MTEMAAACAELDRARARVNDVARESTAALLAGGFAIRDWGPGVLPGRIESIRAVETQPRTCAEE